MSMTKPQMRERISWLTKRNELLEQAVAIKTKDVVDEWESRVLSPSYSTILQLQTEAILKYRDLVLLNGKYLDEDGYAGALNWLADCLESGFKDYLKEPRQLSGLKDNDKHILPV